MLVQIKAERLVGFRRAPQAAPAGEFSADDYPTRAWTGMRDVSGEPRGR